MRMMTDSTYRIDREAMTDPQAITFADLIRVRQEVENHTDALVKAFVVTPLFNHLDGYWQVPYQGAVYVLIGRVQLARVLCELPAVPTVAPFDTLFGIPVLEDENLARNLILNALALAGITLRSP
jgi:hypothetical protein